MSKASSRIAVVYLDRWGNPPGFRKAFLHSLRFFSAGAEFDLIWQMKGYPDHAICHELVGFEQRFSGRVVQIRYPDNLYQFTLALDVAQNMSYEFLLFFTSFSRILAPDWLKSYVAAFESREDCGIVGATGSYERASPDQPFPNCHVRTNAFMVRSKLFSSLEFGRLTTKGDGNLVEAGPYSITRQIRERGLNAFILDRYGHLYDSPTWPLSETFRSGSQRNLLVADNRTFQYFVASSRERLRLARLAWGEAAIYDEVSWIKRRLYRIWWRSNWFGRLAGSLL